MDAPEVAALVLTLDGAVTGWDAAAVALFGYRADEVLGDDLSALLAPEHPSDLSRILAAVARGQRVEGDATMVGRDSIRLRVALNVVPARNDTLQVTAARAFLRDVTRERADDGQAWLTALVESCHDGLHALDARGVPRALPPGPPGEPGLDVHGAGRATWSSCPRGPARGATAASPSATCTTRRST